MNWLYAVNSTIVFLQIKTYLVLFRLFSLKSEQKLVKIAHNLRQKLLQHEQAWKIVSGNHRIAMQLVRLNFGLT